MISFIIYLIIIGAIIGLLARLVVPGRNPIGVFATILVGIVGGLIGGFIGRSIGVGNGLSFLIDVLVAAVFVALLSGGRRGRWGSRV